MLSSTATRLASLFRSKVAINVLSSSSSSSLGLRAFSTEVDNLTERLERAKQLVQHKKDELAEYRSQLKKKKSEDYRKRVEKSRERTIRAEKNRIENARDRAEKIKEKLRIAKEKQRMREQAEKARAQIRDRQDLLRAQRDFDRERKQAFPKKPAAANIIYVKEQFAAVREQNPTLSATEIMPILQKQYAALTPEQKQVYIDLSAEDKKRFEKEREEFFNLNPPAPKRPLSAFLMFLQDILPSLKASHPELKMQDLSRLAGQKYTELPLEKKTDYVEKAKTAFEQYSLAASKHKAKYPHLYRPTHASMQEAE